MKYYQPVFKPSNKLKLNPKTAGGGQFDPPPCCFSKNESSKEKVKPCFFVTFNIIISHIFPEHFIENSSSRSEDMKNFSVNISYFHRFSSIF